MTTFSEFQAYYTRKMWRVGDTEWEEDLPRLVSNAEARIKRDLSHAKLYKEAVVSTNDPAGFDKPADCGKILSVQLQSASATNPASGGWGAAASFVTPAQYSVLVESASRGRGLIACDAGYSVLMETGASDDEARLVRISYIMDIIPYASNPDPSFYDMAPDFYEAAVSVQAYSYLKDFEQSAEYNTQYINTLESMRAESEYLTYPQGQIDSRPAGNVM